MSVWAVRARHPEECEMGNLPPCKKTWNNASEVVVKDALKRGPSRTLFRNEKKINQLVCRILYELQHPPLPEACSFSTSSLDDKPINVFRPATMCCDVANVRVTATQEGNRFAVDVFNPHGKNHGGSFKSVWFGKRFTEEKGCVRHAEVVIGEPLCSSSFSEKKSEAVKKMFFEEACLLEKCKNIAGIVEPLNCVEVTPSNAPSTLPGLQMVFPLFNMGDLKGCVEGLSHKEKEIVCHRLLKTVADLEDQGWIHRDIKWENILIHRNPDGSIRVGLTDVAFLTKHLDFKGGVLKGSVLWLPPEYHYIRLQYKLYAVNQRTYAGIPERQNSLKKWRARLQNFFKDNMTSKIDVWACGMVIAGLLRAQDVWPLLIDDVLVARVLCYQNKNITGMQQVLNGSHPLDALLLKMLAPTQEKRCTAKEALSEFRKAMDLE